ncbi:mucin-5AC-like [Drosophila eugracilis]|uniref:mucin-5AC-like n=1 Tax=Drosophila eugracilis TaxID=29029 RepID=UPI001BD9FDF1|nr:mucin-5AC-like [Drosophila eugracilis]
MPGDKMLSASPRARTSSPVASKPTTKASSETSLATQEGDKKWSVPTSHQKLLALSPLTTKVRSQIQTKSEKSLKTRSQAKMSDDIAFAALARFITVSDRMSHFRTTIETPGQSAQSIHTCKVRKEQVRSLWEKAEREFESCQDTVCSITTEGEEEILATLYRKYEYCYSVYEDLSVQLNEPMDQATPQHSTSALPPNQSNYVPSGFRLPPYQALKDLQSTIQGCLIALAYSDISTENWDCLLVFLCTSRLPKVTLSLWEQSLSSKSDIPTWDEMNTFLGDRYRTLEAIEDMKSSLSNHSSTKSPPFSRKLNSFEAKVVTKPKNCDLCARENHPVRLIQRFLQMSVDARTNYIKQKRLCLNCFARGHQLRECTSIIRCCIKATSIPVGQLTGIVLRVLGKLVTKYWEVENIPTKEEPKKSNIQEESMTTPIEAALFAPRVIEPVLKENPPASSEVNASQVVSTTPVEQEIPLFVPVPAISGQSPGIPLYPPPPTAAPSPTSSAAQFVAEPAPSSVSSFFSYAGEDSAASLFSPPTTSTLFSPLPTTQSAPSATEERKSGGGLFSLSSFVPTGVLQNIRGLVQSATGRSSEPGYNNPQQPGGYSESSTGAHAPSSNMFGGLNPPVPSGGNCFVPGTAQSVPSTEVVAPPAVGSFFAPPAPLPGTSSRTVAEGIFKPPVGGVFGPAPTPIAPGLPPSCFTPAGVPPVVPQFPQGTHQNHGSTSSQTLDDRRSRGTQTYRCRVCRGIHLLRKCTRFLRLRRDKRLRAVLINKYCANSLAHQHSGEQCRSGDTCKKCGQNRHTLLHLHERAGISRRQPIQPRRQPPPGGENVYAKAAQFFQIALISLSRTVKGLPPLSERQLDFPPVDLSAILI